MENKASPNPVHGASGSVARVCSNVTPAAKAASTTISGAERKEANGTEKEAKMNAEIIQQNNMIQGMLF
jgi:hypothetical protein